MGLRGPVLVATDLSAPADAALRQGESIARELGTSWFVCHILPEAFADRTLAVPPAADLPSYTQIENDVRRAVAQRVHDVTGSAAESLRVEIEPGTPHSGILRIAARIAAGLIIVGPGRTAHRVARAAAVPVMVARPYSRGGAVLGATDFSDPALPAVNMAIDEARRRDMRLKLVHCLNTHDVSGMVLPGLTGGMPIPPLPPDLISQSQSSARQELEEALATRGAAGETIVIQVERPAAGIVALAQEVATALVVVGTRGRTGLTRLALGSVAEDVIDLAPCSVLVVPLDLET